MTDRMMRLLSEPLLQFLLIGAAIYGAYAAFGPEDEAAAERVIRVDAGRIDSFISEWERRWKRPPTRQELEGIIDNYVRESLLYEQALAMGLNEDDPITRRRMAQKLEFLTKDLALLKEPEAGELEHFFAEHQARYRGVDLITFSHAFINPDVRDSSAPDDAAELLAQLQAEGEPEPRSLDVGDRFMLGSYYPEVTEAQVRRSFGERFAESLMPLSPGRWHGPVTSGYGLHLVYVYELQQAPPPQFERVRQAVLRDWQQQQQDQFNANFVAGLKSTYAIDIADIPTDRILEAGSASRRLPGAEVAPLADSAPVPDTASPASERSSSVQPEQEPAS